MKLHYKIRRWFRSSITGRFVSRRYAQEHPDTTEQQKK